MKKSLLLAILGTAIAASAAVEIPPIFFMADFDTEATMTKATVGKDMEFVTDGGPIQFIDDEEGVDEEDGYVLVPLGSYIKADFSDLPGFVDPADPDNPYVGTYTVVFDIRVPKIGVYYSLLQSNPWNTTDVKLCINKAGTYGSGFLNGYNSEWKITPDRWYRLAFTPSYPDGHYGLYVNGDPIEEDTSGWLKQVDGKYALEKEGTLFFADDDGDDAPIYCSKLIFFDKALTKEEVKALGTPRTEVAGIPAITSKDNVSLTVNNGAVNVKVNDGKVANVAVYNVSGCKVVEATVNDEYSWNSADATAGAYIVKVVSGDNVKTAKLIAR